MRELRMWTSALEADLGIDSDQLDYELIDAVAREVGRAVADPAASLSAYLLGMAVGRGFSSCEAARRVCERARCWPRVDWRD
ncbi:hypothetical protein H0B56_22505 [Haloechinothrix sp. YIM 98757]|uniref:DUF6457 domain-containing protein n=1 Tax=Haloechinothrix aidingensis TaxID=2752311 RepID=A0A838AG39_9PSEU|nr:DUF6457 domain-containing protein [Haloechinothrix aidingensis]MBA0128326.1 hypothetical protein [Haloechinothrix aidingensis]